MMRTATFLLSLLGVMTSAIAEEPGRFTDEQLNFFESKIRPVLVDHCYECHAAGAKIVQGGLRLDHRDGLLKGGDTGTAIVAHKADQSLLIKALKYDGVEMPPKGKLPASVIKDFETWIAMGAPDPREAAPGGPRPKVDLNEGRKFWAFQPVSDSPPPIVKDGAWPIESLDHFILAKLEASDLKPVGDADRYTWLRRVSLDLTGLPPTPNEIDAFIRDNSPRACEAVVDRLLASRAFGERWARHWLDLTGYADMMGTSNNVFAEHAWRYRDYLIEAYHKDKPFDRFVREQIAGDLLPATSPTEQAENITATGFLMVGDVEIVEPDKKKLEADHIDTQVNKIGMTFLGMTLGCVRCHDHKFDPLQLSDYYGIAGIMRSSPSTHKIPFGVWSLLNSTDLPETPVQLAARQKLETDHETKLAEMKAEREKLEGERKSVIAELEEIAKQEKNEADAAAKTGVVQTADETESPLMKKERLTKHRDALSARLQPLGPAIQHAEFFRSKVPRAFAMQEDDQPADMPIYIRGNPYAPGAIVPRGVIQVASWDKAATIPAGQSGRLQLADWLADSRNPLTSRVIVNRIWQKLFGEGLVRSVDYFGTRGERPSHPELLDHLATRFLHDGWSHKKLIRSLVLSRTYRLSSTNDPMALTTDPDNRLLWRSNRQRLDAEAIRDGLLAVSGELVPSEGGPALVLEFTENCGDLVQIGVNPPNYSHRRPRPTQEFQRSIYLPVMRTNTTNLDRIRNHFDFVNPAQIAGQRPQTVVPTQSLFVMNNDLFRKRAKVLADRLIAEAPQADIRIEQLWLRVFNRPITTTEQKNVTTFLRELDAGLPDMDAAAKESLKWQELCHSLLASNEFIFRI
ncbi:MAG: Planctomycete cytochrome [Schlesneria sp.]|nr:Planctomycete cytochrome [Schlesneria sp.]